MILEYLIHSFIHEGFVQGHSFPIREINQAFQIIAHGITHESKWIVSQAKLEIAGMDFQANLLILKLGNIDAILGMNWMSQHQSFIQYATKFVKMQHPSGRCVILYTSMNCHIALHL